MKRSTADFLLEFSPVIIEVIHLVEKLATQLFFRAEPEKLALIHKGELKWRMAFDRLQTDPACPPGLSAYELARAIDRAVLWQNTFGWRDDHDTKFEQR